MATGHILPGYGCPVSRFTRAKSAYPLDRTKLKEWAMQQVPPVTLAELRRIKEDAVQSWTSFDRSRTTYDSHFEGRQLNEQTKFRPLSPTRRNKPHPPAVFLTNRLHYVSGFHNADATMRRGPYQVDESLPDSEKYRRQEVREKYAPRPHTAAIEQYTDKFGLRQMMSPVEAQSAEAWLKIADDKDKHKVEYFLEDFRREANKSATGQAPTYTGEDKVASVHRWMKFAGNKEQSNLHIPLTRRPTTAPESRGPGTTPRFQTLGDRRNQDVEAVTRFRYVHKPTHGDFLIHPQWPPTMPHHRVPGFPVQRA